MRCLHQDKEKDAMDKETAIADRQIEAAEALAAALAKSSIILCRSSPESRRVEIIFPELEDAQTFHREALAAWEAAKGAK